MKKKKKNHKHEYSKLMGIDDYCVGCSEYKIFIENPDLKKKHG